MDSEGRRSRTVVLPLLVCLLLPPGLDCLLGAPSPFIRGDANHDRTIDVSDPVRILGAMFRGQLLPCRDAADANDDGQVDISDAVKVILHLFAAMELPPPFPESGLDPTADLLSCVDPCPWTFKVELLGWAPDERLNPSGIAVGRQNPHLIWVINDFDSAQDRRLYALDHQGTTVGVFMLCNGPEECDSAPATCSPPAASDIHCDWEGLAIAEDEGGKPVILVGDIGGNRNRGHAQGNFYWMHRVPEPSLPPGHGLEVSLFRDQGQFDTLYFRYPGDPPVDAEALLFDRQSGDIFIISQQVWSGEPEPRWSEKRSLYRYPSPQRPGLLVTLEHIGDIDGLPNGAFVSGGDLSPRGDLLALKVADSIYLLPWSRNDPLSTFDHPETWCALRLEAYIPHTHTGAVSFDTQGRLLSMEEMRDSLILRVEL